jgi:hypothetical protein
MQGRESTLLVDYAGPALSRLMSSVMPPMRMPAQLDQ